MQATSGVSVLKNLMKTSTLLIITFYDLIQYVYVKHLFFPNLFIIRVYRIKNTK